MTPGMIYFVLTFLVFQANEPPVTASKVFPTVTECQKTEGDALTGVYNDDSVTGWIIVDECKPIGGKADKS